MKRFQIPILSTSLLGFCFLSGLDGPPANADFVFGTPTNLGPTVNTSWQDDSPTMPADGLSMFFSSTRLGGIPLYDLFVITRETLEDEWSAPVNLGPPVNTEGVDVNPSISADGLTLVFGSNRPGGSGGISDIWMTTRETKDAPWADPENLGPLVNSPYDEWTQGISADALELYFGSNRPGGAGGDDLWVTTRATTQSAWGPPVNLGPTDNSPYADLEPVISPDGLCLMFWSVRPGGYGSRDIWITTRASRNDTWRTPINPGPPLNSPKQDQPHYLSPDGSVLYFSSNQPGGYGVLDIWQAPIRPVCDFNSDGQVDLVDVFIMLEHWCTDYPLGDPLYDIGSMPWGDGLVEARDLIVLAEHMVE
ncbi:MAG: hypothetical protein A2Z25_12590 [Planctomycetes bacterium RBG_16_55_9]|nr:MAG: hypothetical protein A2Z25_12590 [Planctomycetes bacterium RBG_16_55_9]